MVNLVEVPPTLTIPKIQFSAAQLCERLKIVFLELVAGAGFHARHPWRAPFGQRYALCKIASMRFCEPT
jgi:hypothetical protein